ncbi:pentatricopeptide repeat-containing protein At3g29230-like [Euphorbia lathyris]|uniref:pentatricopeptide repeat-containing protein At3g29230-like n=1 Tax=Euphorbia lathyris TaxID=212925 RepID=UPI0033137156
MALFTCNSSLPSPGLRNWNSIIKKQMEMGEPENAIMTYLKMQALGFHGDNYTFPLLLKAAGRISAPNLGFSLHGHTIKTGFSAHVFVQTALIDMYGTLHCIVDARKVFDKMPERDLVAWNSMLDAFTCNYQMDDAIYLFDLMPLKDLSSFNILISGYSIIGEVLSARRVFDQMGEKDTVSWNSMISAYTRAGEMKMGLELFSKMPIRNGITWNTMITGCLQNDQFREAIELFEEMKNTDCKPDYLTMVSVLSASAHLGSLELGQRFHIYAMNHNIASNPYVVTALIDMYAKCGSIEQALLVFVKSESNDIYSWNAMITGLSLHGSAISAIQMFRNMRAKNIKPDDITFIGLLNACSHSGFVQEGCELFNSMEKGFGVSPKLEHYGCVIDLLSRAGYLDEAFRVIEAMGFEPGESVLGALLNGCVIHKDVERGKRVMIKMMSCRGKGLSDGELMMFSNLYAACGDWEEANKWREMMNEAGIVKTAGLSVIEVDGRFCKFMAGEISKDFATIDV